MILDEGDKVLIVHRRLFAEDAARYFVGVVDGYENGITKASGFTWVREQFGGNFYGKKGLTTKIFSLASGTLIVYRLPQSVDPVKVIFENSNNGSSWITNGAEFRMDISEKEFPRATGRKG